MARTKRQAKPSIPASNDTPRRGRKRKATEALHTDFAEFPKQTTTTVDVQSSPVREETIDIDEDVQMNEDQAVSSIPTTTESTESHDEDVEVAEEKNAEEEPPAKKRKTKEEVVPRERIGRATKARAVTALLGNYLGMQERAESAKKSRRKSTKDDEDFSYEEAKKEKKAIKKRRGKKEKDDDLVEEEEDEKPKKAKRGKGTRATKGAAKPKKAGGRGRQQFIVPLSDDAKSKVEEITDETFSSTSDDITTGGPIAASRDAIRAVLTKNYDLLQKVIDDVEHVSDPFILRSVHCDYNALDLALRSNDLKAATMLLKKSDNAKPRVQVNSNLQQLSTGSYSKYTYGRKIRDIHAGRGSREGINALTHDTFNYSNCVDNSKQCTSAMKYPLESETINFMITDMDCRYPLAEMGVLAAVEAGNLEVASLVAEGTKDYGGGLNVVHLEALKLRNDDEEFTKFQARSATKKSDTMAVTPVHFAAINPNVKFLKALTDITGIHVVDNFNRKPIHFAAACAKPTTLKFLIERGAAVDEQDKHKRIPLHYACKYGRVDNIELLLNAENLPSASKKDGRGQTPIHLAAFYGHNDVVKKLLELGVNPNELNSMKQSALFSAATGGHLDVLETLIDAGASLVIKDKHGRIALLLAVMNGHFDIVKKLLLNDINANAADSSGNTALHYAVAYGWINICKLLVAAGADASAKNDWKYNALSIAFLKNLKNMSDYLLDLPGTNVNDQDGEGRTLLHTILQTKTDATLAIVEQLVTEKNAKTTIIDNNGVSLFHLLATETHKNDLQLAELLLESGSPIDHANVENVTPMEMAAISGNTEIFCFLLNNGSKVRVESKLLHKVVEKKAVCKLLLTQLYTTLSDAGQLQTLKELANAIDDCGRTPLHLFLQSSPSSNTDGSSFLDDEVDSDEEEEEKKKKETAMNTEDDMEDDVQMNDEETPTGTVDLDEMEDEDENEMEEELDDYEEDGFLVKTSIKQSGPTVENDINLYLEFVRYYVEVTGVDINTPIVEIKNEEKKKPDNDDEDAEDYSDEDDGDEDNYGYSYNYNQSNTQKNTMIGYTALHLAVINTNADLVKFLIQDMKANPNAKDFMDRTPLHLITSSASSNDQNAFGIVKFLVQNGASMTQIDKHQRSAVFYLFIAMYKANTSRNNHYRYGYYGYENKNESTNEPIEILSEFATYPEFDISMKDKHGKTLLHYSCYKGFTICSMFLIEKGSDINAVDNIGNTPLAYAMTGGHIDFAVNLINRGADFKINIHSAKTVAKENDYSNVQYLGMKKKAKKQDTTKTDESVIEATPLFKFVLAHNHLGLAFLLINRGIKTTDAVLAALETKVYHMAFKIIQKTSKEEILKLHTNKETLLHIASKFSGQSYDSYCRKIAKLLVQKGVNLNSLDQDGKSALHFSAVSNVIITKYLLKHGAKLFQDSKDKQTPLHLACKLNNSEVVDLILAQPTAKSAINTQDASGKTPLHYAIAPSLFGTYNNEGMVKSLIDGGARVDVADKNKQSPLFYALFFNSENTAALMKETNANKIKTLKSEAEKEKKKYSEQFFKSKVTFKDLDVKGDSAKARKALEDKEDTEPKAPNVHVSLRSNKHNKVLQDEDGNYYDVMLTKSTVAKGNYGKHDFYKQQIVYNEIQDLYIFLTNYGRIGTSGQHQQTPFTRETAISEFEKNFKAKSGLAWENRHDPPVLNKYSVVQLTNTKSKEKLKPINLENCEKSQLPLQVQNLFKLLCDVTILSKGLHNYGVDMTLAKLQRNTLEEALQILNTVKVILDEFSSDTISKAEKKVLLDKIMDHSSRFYTLIPHRQYRDAALPPLNDHTLQEKRKMIEDLLDLQVTSRIILASTTKTKVLNPLDYAFHALKVELTPIDTSSDDFEPIRQYINSCPMEKKIANIFRVFKQDEHDRFQKHLNNKNRMMLWHGSSVTNFISILSQGLKIAPPEAPASGFMFGKGVYFADMIDKSVGYCRGETSKGMICLLLCEVALGEMYETKEAEYMEKAKPGFESTKGVGRQGPDTNNAFVTFDGVKIPNGPIVTTGQENDSFFYNRLNNNEYIVYDESQVRIRYVVQLKI